MSLDTVSARLLNSPSDLTDITSSTTETSLISPVTTPNSLHEDFLPSNTKLSIEEQEEEKCLTKQPKTTSTKNDARKTRLKTKKSKQEEYRDFKRKWNDTIWNLVPCFMAVISIIQVLVYMLASETTSKLLRFEPSLRHQAWRFASYMLLHWSKTHLVLNVIIQFLLAIPLEVEQGGVRTVAVYFGGGIFGALGACLLQPQPMVGASAGVYALLISHLAHLYLNFPIIKYRKYRIFSVCVLAISDFAFYAFHARQSGHPTISLGAHASGGLAGVLLGLLIYRGAQENEQVCVRRLVRSFAALIIFLLLGGCIVVMCLLPERFFVR